MCLFKMFNIEIFICLKVIRTWVYSGKLKNEFNRLMKINLKFKTLLALCMFIPPP